MAVLVMVIEDDASIGGSLTQVLSQSGYEVRWRRTGESAIAAAAEQPPEIALLDLGLPDMDGVEVCRRLRASHPRLAIIVVTARDTEIDAVLGLDAGADDYVTKPFRLAELLARLRAHERRRERVGGDTLSVGEIVIDVEGRRAAVNGAELTLSPKEFDLLALLSRDSGKVLSRERIIDVVWDEHWFKSTKTLDMHIVSLRRKLAAAGATVAHITTLRGVGYRLDIS
ncbi:MAG: response regulator transcription factor [Candidatus Dormibacteria bacterium]